MLFSADFLHSQSEKTITIRVMDSKTGLPVTKDDLHFYLWAVKEDPGAFSYSPDTVLSGNQTGTGTGGVAIPDGLNYIRTWVSFGPTSWGLVSCDIPKGKPHAIPIYSVSKILNSGVVAPNLCSRKTATAKPGEFVLFVRQMTFWEAMQI